MNFLNKSVFGGLKYCFLISKLSLMFLVFMANPLIANELDLATAVKLMTDHNPSLKVFDFKQAALIGSSHTAGLKPALAVAFESENFTGTSHYSSLDRGEYSVSLSSVIEFGDKRNARLNLVTNQSQLVEAQRIVKSLDLLAQLTRSFIQVLATQQRINLADESLQLANEIYLAVKQKAAVGAISDAEVKRSYAMLKQAELTHASEQQKHQSQKVKLSLFWAEKIPNFATVSGDIFNFGEVQDINSLMVRVEQSSFFNALNYKQQVAESKLRLAQTQAKSDVNWTVGVRRIEDTNDATLTAGFSVPLFSSKRNTGLLIEAEAAIEQVKSEQQMTLLALFGQLQEITSLRESAVNRYQTLNNEIVPALSTALELTKSAYLDGRYGYFEYTAAKGELIQAKKALIDTAENILFYGVEIEQMTANSFYTNDQLSGIKS